MALETIEDDFKERYDTYYFEEQANKFIINPF